MHKNNNILKKTFFLLSSCREAGLSLDTQKTDTARVPDAVGCRLQDANWDTIAVRKSPNSKNHASAGHLPASGTRPDELPDIGLSADEQEIYFGSKAKAVFFDFYKDLSRRRHVLNEDVRELSKKDSSDSLIREVGGDAAAGGDHTDNAAGGKLVPSPPLRRLREDSSVSILSSTSEVTISSDNRYLRLLLTGEDGAPTTVAAPHAHRSRFPAVDRKRSHVMQSAVQEAEGEGGGGEGWRSDGDGDLEGSKVSHGHDETLLQRDGAVTSPVRESNQSSPSPAPKKRPSLLDTSGSASTQSPGAFQRTAEFRAEERRLIAEADMDMRHRHLKAPGQGKEAVGAFRPLSARTQFLLECVKLDIPPRSSLLIRKDIVANLNLSHQLIGDEVVQLLAKSLSSLPLLSGLNLADNKLTDKGIRAVMGALSHCVEFKELDLSANKVGVGATDSLAEYVRGRDCPLESLVVRNAGLSDEFIRRVVTVRLSGGGVLWCP